MRNTLLFLSPTRVRAPDVCITATKAIDEQVDPIGRQGWIATAGKLEDAPDGILRANGIEMPLNAVLEE